RWWTVIIEGPETGRAPGAPLFPLRDAVLLEPGQHALPAVLGRLLAVARAVIGVERVRHAFVDMDLGLLVVAEGLQAGAQHFDALERNALVGAAVQAEHRAVDLVGDVH